MSSRFAFTINNPTGLLDLDALPDWVTYIVYQEEVAPTTGTHHFQGYMELSVRKRITTLLNGLGWDDPCHLSVARAQPSVNEAYCTKEDTRVDGPYRRGVISADTVGQGNRQDLQDVLAAIRDGMSDFELFTHHPQTMARHRNFVSEYRALWLNQQLEMPNFVPRPGWQTDLSNDLDGPVSRRQVIWIYETLGNVGKSYMARNYKRGEVYYVTGGKHADIYHAYASQRFVFFDVPRSAADRFPYEVLEKFKDGILFQSKYQSKVLYFDVPHVVVFANFAPDRTKLSADRWDIRDVGLAPGVVQGFVNGAQIILD